jgi:hypothetical protein
MTAEGVAATAAIGGVAISVLGALAGLIYHAGRHSQRLTAAEKDIGDLKDTQAEHGRAIIGFEQALELLREVRDDVKGLLTGRSRPAGRGRS